MSLAALAILSVAVQQGGGAAEELRHVNRQLEELYGPLLFLVEESRLAVDDVLQKLGRPGIFPLNPEKKDEEEKFWIFRAENEFMPRNERMCKIVRKKGHWAEGAELPASFTALLEHQETWRLLHARWKKEGVAYGWGSRTPFPRPLLPELRRSFQGLKARQAELVKGVPGAELRHVERQIDELYGPLVTLNHEGKASFEGLLKMLGREHVFPLEEAKKEQELRLWLFWAENSFLPRNERQRKLLEGKFWLLDGDKLPDSHRKFLDHVNSWQIEHLRWQKEKVDYRWHSKINCPVEYSAEVEETLKRLKERHAALLKK